MKIFFVRHGESLDASQDIVQRSFTPLSDLGLRQADMVANILKGNAFDHIYSSPLKRAYETAQEVVKCNKWNNDINVLEFLHEEKRPKCLEGLKHTDVEYLRIDSFVGENYYQPGFQYDGCDNFFTLRDRVIELRKLLESVEDQDSNILLFTHAVVIKSFFANTLLNNMHNEELHKAAIKLLKVRNCAVVEFQYKEMWKLIGLRNNIEEI
jgi:broad specificity phosphatase PhoE